MTNVREILKMERQTFRDFVADNKLEIYYSKDSAVLKRLAEVSALKPDRKQACLGKISHLIRVMNKIGAWPLLLRMFKEAVKSEPPSSANDLGSRRLERATNPMQPLSVVITSATAANDISCDPDEFSPTEERMDREPAFISSKPGR